VEFQILGPLEVLDDGTPVAIAGSKRRAVLALLLLHANEVVRSERLIDDLWGENAPRNAPAALHNHVSRLRKALGADVLARREWGYVLRAEPDSIDLHRFECLVAAAEPLPARERSAKLADALALWRGPALADLTAQPGLQTEIARLDELRLTTLERRIDADLEAGRNADLVGEIEALIAAQPLREHVRGQLILALYRAGRQAEALEVYRETRRVLTDELGLEPSPALKELEKAILRQDPAIGAVPPIPLQSEASPLEPSRRLVRRSVLLPLVALAILGAGIGVPFALVSGSSHSPTPVQARTVTTDIPITPTQNRATSQAAVVRHAQKRRRHYRRRSKRRALLAHATLPTGSSATSAQQKTAASTAATGSSGLPPPPPPPHRGRRPKKPRTVAISDDFSGGQIDGTIWYEIYQGTGWDLSPDNGQLEFTFPPGTAPGGQWDNYGGHVGTLCKFPGDFDARVDFSLVQWPAANGIVVSLWTFFKPNNEGWEAWRQSSSQWGEQFGSYLGQGHGGGVSLDDATGTLRLRRKDGLVTAYFLRNAKWVSLGSARNARTTVIAVGAGSGENPPVRDDRVVVDLDNFTITAADPICPPGAQGSG
jgi:DNA-binding SARP family transcriptional activator